MWVLTVKCFLLVFIQFCHLTFNMYFILFYFIPEHALLDTQSSENTLYIVYVCLVGNERNVYSCTFVWCPIFILNITLDQSVMVFPQRFNRRWKNHPIMWRVPSLDWGSELHQKEKERKLSIPVFYLFCLLDAMWPATFTFPLPPLLYLPYLPCFPCHDLMFLKTLSQSQTFLPYVAFAGHLVTAIRKVTNKTYITENPLALT